jgi:hypothetical protein
MLGVLALVAPAAAGANVSKASPVKAGRVHLKLSANAYNVNGQEVTEAGRGVSIEGRMRPYFPGQVVRVTAYRGRHRIMSRRLTVRRSRNGKYGRFSFGVRGMSAGHVTVWVTHDSSPQAGHASVKTGYSSLNSNIGWGSTGTFVQLIQHRLADLHFYLAQTGVYDSGTGLAIDAYHRLLGWGTSQNLDSRTISYLLNGWGEFKVRYPGDGKHVEGNLSNQLLALIYGTRVYAIYPTSSGKPSTPTVLGQFHVYRRVPGYQPDGMYYSSYFTGGYAIHGYDPAPDYPASHGCFRVPIQDAISIYNWLNFGDGVDVYY